MSDTAKSIAGLSPEEKRAYLAQLLRKKTGEASEQQNPIPALSSLSHGQRALWFLHQLAPQSPAYNLLYAARIRTPLDILALQRSFRALLQRHPILTATYTMHNGEPVQAFHPQQATLLELVDASAWSWEQLNQRLQEQADRPFDLERGPILRIILFSRAEQDYVLSLIIHHIAVDFWSLDLIIHELRLLYAAERTGVPAPLPARPPQYTDYIRWQAEMLAGPEGERLWAYWRQELAGELPMLNLPLDRPRPPVQTYRGASYTFDFGEELSRQLKAFAQAERVTLYTLLLAAFETLLFRYTDQNDILIGTTTVARSRADLQGIVGYLANPVVLRVNPAADLSFKDLLSQVRRKVITVLEHQDYPFPLLVERLQPRRDASYSPLFQTMFIWDILHGHEDVKALLAATYTDHVEQPETAARLAQESLKLETYALGQQGAPFDLSLRISEPHGSLSADFRYNVDLFDAATMAHMAQHFRILLAGIVTHPEQQLSDLPLLTGAEQHQLLVEWNDTQSDYPEHLCIHQLFELQVQQQPEAVAVVFEDNALTYGELNRRANALAHTLQASGVGPDGLVGVCMERSIEMIIALLGILKAGGAYVPLDPAYPRERLDYMIHDARMPVLLTQSHLLDLLPGDDTKVIYLDSGWSPGNGHVGADLSRPSPIYRPLTPQEENPVSAVQPANLAYMIYTSGSTGKPKGVMNTHRGLCNRLHWMQQAYQLTTQDRVMQKTPFSFDVSVWEFFWPLITGACLVVARPGGHQNPDYLVSLIEAQQITTLHFVPSMLQVFLMAPGLERCKSLKRVICSGEALPFELQERFFSYLDAELHNLYGPTEAAIDVTYWQCQRESRERVVPIGYPIANTQIYILDRSMHPVPVGVAGELYIGGAGVARGYFNRPELTAEKFIPDPFSKEAGARLFKTGDLARYRADGAIEFLGRIDHQVKIRGFRIELGEIEVVLGQHPAVEEVVVVAREDIPGNKSLVAYIIPTVEASHSEFPSVEALRSFLKKELPDYMIPSAFVFLDALPLMSNGKVNRLALPAPDMTRPKLEKAFVPPRNQVEELLARIWAQVLGIDQVGIHDNFFDLGGASIQGLQIITKANEAGLHLTPELLFEHQTIAELAVGADLSRPSPIYRPAPTPSATKQPVPTAKANMIIESIGVYLPPKVVSTREVLQSCHKPVVFPLEQLTGIKSRRMAGETEFSIDLAKKAVENCLANSRYHPGDIDLLICSNISRCDGPNFQYSFEPNSSIRLKHHFGFTNALVFDVSNACTGMFTAASIVDAFLKAGLIRRGMVVSGEYITHLVLTAQKEIENYMDSRLACLTLGDAGAAMILEQAPDNKVGFHELELYTLGRYYDLCIAKATDKEHGGAIMFTDSVKVSSVNIQQAVSHAAYVLERSAWSPEAFQHIIVHQTSQMTINDAAREINSFLGRELCTKDNVINNIAERGNTATTTHVVALMDYILSNKIHSGDNVIFGITGSGATIGTALYTFDDLPDRLRQIASGQKKVKVKEKAEQLPLTPPTRRVRVESIGTLQAQAQVQRKTLELAQAAATNCLEKSSYSKSDIDLLIFAGVYRDDFICEPAIAAMIAGELRMNDTIESQQDKKTFALDLFNSGIGFLKACYVSTGMIQAKKMQRVLVVASEVENNKQFFTTELLGLSEAGSAVILDESPGGQTGFGNFVFRDFTSYIDTFKAYGVQRNGKTGMHFEKDPGLETCYLQCIREAVDELLRVEQLDVSQIKVILPPQISPAFITALSNTMNLSRDRFVDLAQGGDLFTSSLAYTLQYVREQHLVKPGDIGLIINVGTGIQVGCATYYF
jgi:amino acid adenylation domain-containing protein